jgi:hypothetical protein
VLDKRTITELLVLQDGHISHEKYSLESLELWKEEMA